MRYFKLSFLVLTGIVFMIIDGHGQCLEFASGPFVNIQAPPCDATCGTPVEPGFQVFENEAYFLNGISGSEYTISFCNGYDPLVWDAIITVGVSDDAGGAVPGSEIAFANGCSLTFTVPTTDTYVIVISGLGNCGGPNNPTDNGFLTLDCGPGGAICDPPPEPCLEFASGPFVNIQTPPCDATCGTPVEPGFQVFENEAYFLNGISGSEYTISFCNGYDSLVWDAIITVGVSDDAGGAVPGSEIAFANGCSLTFTVPSTDTYVIVISGFGNCGGPNNPTDNGFLTLDCGPGGAICDPPPEPCLEFASGPFVNIQTPPCDATCGTPVEPGFQVFENEAYFLNGISGSEYTISFCNGYDSLVWDAIITVGVSDDAGGAVPGSEIAFANGCSLTFTVPSTDTYVIVISGFGNCGGPNNPTDNGFLTLDCGPGGAICDPPPEPCLEFASGPFVNIQTPPCDATCGTPVEPGFQVFENEAYFLNGISGSEYTISFCNGYDSLVWDAIITVGVSDDAGGAVPGSEIAFANDCSLTFTVPATDTYVIVISGFGNCGGPNNPTDNGFLTLDCGPGGAFCTEPTECPPDNEPPVISGCPSDISMSTDIGQCAAMITYTPPTATDNCPGLSFMQTAGLGSGALFSLGTTTETYTAIDGEGAMTTCSFVISVVDTEAPIAICQDITLQLDATGSGTVSANEIDAGSSDNCGVTDFSLDNVSFDCEDIGQVTVTLTVSDMSGNSNSCTAMVEVEDDPVTMFCENISVNVHDQLDSVPDRIYSQAYPNPFEEQVTIAFAIPEDGHTVVSIYTLDGRALAEKDLGVLRAHTNHTYTFESVGWMASGVVLYKIVSGGNITIGKLTAMP